MKKYLVCSAQDILEELVAAWSRARGGESGAGASSLRDLILVGGSTGIISRSCRGRAAGYLLASTPIAYLKYGIPRLIPTVEVAAVTEVITKCKF